MNDQRLQFLAPRHVAIEDIATPEPGPGELLVRTSVSAISAGTELLLYRGEWPEGLALDDTLACLEQPPIYPLSYGYAAVGRVAALGSGVDGHWLGRDVFAFHPHASCFVTAVEDVVTLPEGMSAERAALLPTVETAVNLMLDARPLVGERALVIGQGMVGLVATSLLSSFPLARLWVVESLRARRERALEMGAERALSPTELVDEQGGLRPEVERDAPGGFDLSLELSGRPESLNAAIAATAFEGRVVVGSWYGSKRAPVDLGSHFHRGRLEIVSSQVSHIASDLQGRWTRARRLETAWKTLAELPVNELVTDRFPLERAADAYELLDEGREETLQVLLTYT